MSEQIEERAIIEARRADKRLLVERARDHLYDRANKNEVRSAEVVVANITYPICYIEINPGAAEDENLVEAIMRAGQQMKRINFHIDNMSLITIIVSSNSGDTLVSPSSFENDLELVPLRLFEAGLLKAPKDDTLIEKIIKHEHGIEWMTIAGDDHVGDGIELIQKVAALALNDGKLSDLEKNESDIIKQTFAVENIKIHLEKLWFPYISTQLWRTKAIEASSDF